MTPNDIKNLVGWLQAIYKEAQTTRGEVSEMRSKVNMIPEIRDSTHKGTEDSGDAERKIEDTRKHLDDRLNHLESAINDLKGMVKDLQGKISHLK